MKIILAIIGAIATITVALIGYLGSIKGASLPIEATQTAESKITATNVFLPVPPSPTLTPEPTASIVLAYPTPQQIPTQDYFQLFPQLDKTSTPSIEFPFVVIKFPGAGRYEILTKEYRSVLILDINSSTLNQTILLPPGEYIVVMLPSEFSSLEEFIKYANGISHSCSNPPCDPPVSGFWEITVPSK